MPNTVSLDVSRDGLVAHMRDQFVHGDTFLRELLQNARRAGASRIDVELAPYHKELIISDNGRGIAMPEDLFVLGRSGFRNDDQVEQSEKPFGMGFAASLFAADFIAISTRSFSCSFNTAAVLNFVTIDVCDLPGFMFDGTSIVLRLNEDRFKMLTGGLTTDQEQCDQLHKRLERIVEGFPVPVSFNSVELPRENALDSSFEEHDGLSIRIDFDAFAEARPGRGNFTGVDAYFQGLPLNLEKQGLGERHIAVHVSDRFRVRTPDRDCLVHEHMPAFREALNGALESMWVSFLERRKAAMPAEDFLNTWIAACQHFKPSLLNDLPLPPHLYDVWQEPPRHERYMGELSGARADQGFLPVGSPVAILDTDYIDEGDLGRAPIGLYACLKGIAVIDTSRLPQDHWAVQSGVRLDGLEQTLTLAPTGVKDQCSFWATFDRFEVVFCDHYVLDPGNGDEAIEVTHWPVWDDSSTQLRLLLPRAARQCHIEDVLLQACSYRDEFDDFCEDGLTEDTDRLTATAQLVFGDDCSVLNGYLRQQLGSVCNALRGRRFSLEIDDHGEPTVKAA